MGGSKRYWEDMILKTNEDQAIDEIKRLNDLVEEHLATIRNKDHIIGGLKSKIKKLKGKEGVQRHVKR